MGQTLVRDGLWKGIVRSELTLDTAEHGIEARSYGDPLVSHYSTLITYALHVMSSHSALIVRTTTSNKEICPFILFYVGAIKFKAFMSLSKSFTSKFLQRVPTSYDKTVALKLIEMSLQ